MSFSGKLFDYAIGC